MNSTEKIKELEKEIEKYKKGCGARKQYNDGIIRFYTCGEKVKCPNCREMLIEEEAKLSVYKEWEAREKEMNEKVEKLKDYIRKVISFKKIKVKFFCKQIDEIFQEKEKK